MARTRKPKLDVSKERQLKLREIIDTEKNIYDINLSRRRNLEYRKDNEICRLSVSFLRKVYTNIPIVHKNKDGEFHLNYNDNSNNNQQFLFTELKSTKIKYKGELFKLCEIEIETDWWSTKDVTIKVRYSDDWERNLIFQSQKLKHLSSIHDRVIVLQEDYISKRKNIENYYFHLMNKLDICECRDKYRDAENQLNVILDHLKFEPGLEYLFDSNARFHYGKRRRDCYDIKRLKVLKTTNQYAFVKIMVNWSDVYGEKEYRMKKVKILEVLKSNKYHFEKNVERKKKLERLLEESC